MKMILATTMVLLVGCGAKDHEGLRPSGGPAAGDVEAAFEVTWDLHLSEHERPTVQWYDNRSCPVLCGYGMDDGSITLGWHEGMKISESKFPEAEAEYLFFKINGFVGSEAYVVTRFRNYLRASGL